MNENKITVADIEALCDKLAIAENEVIALYTQEYPSEEHLAAFARLWDYCLNYQAAFENFSHQ